MKQHEDFADLACGFIQNTLSAKERRRVQGLVLHNPEFLEVLKLELSLKNNAAPLKQRIPDSLKKRVYSNITTCTNRLLCKKVLQTVLEATLPAITGPVLQLLERSVFANE